jgi:hypothetical protein
MADRREDIPRKQNAGSFRPPQGLTSNENIPDGFSKEVSAESDEFHGIDDLELNNNYQKQRKETEGNLTYPEYSDREN